MRSELISEVCVADARRLPVAPAHGALSGWHPVEMLAALLRDLSERHSPGVLASAGLFVGCASQVGGQAANVGRAAALAAGWDDTAVTMVGANDLAGHEALHVAAAWVAAQPDRVAVVAAIDHMSSVPFGAALLAKNYGLPWGRALLEQFDGEGGLAPIGQAAERAAAEAGLGRPVLDEYVTAARERAAKIAAPAIVPIEARMAADESQASRSQLIEFDEPPLPQLESAAMFSDDGVIAASNLASPSDGAAALVLCSPKHTAAPLAIVSETRVVMGSPAAPLATVPALLAGLACTVIETDAATAVAGLAVQDAVPQAVLDPTGGALAIGRPGAASALRAAVDLCHAPFTRDERVVMGVASDGVARATRLSPPPAGNPKSPAPS